jgi:hypothetical protein
MKIRILLILMLLATVAAFVAFQFAEPWILEKLSPKFPKSEENEPGYYADMVGFLVGEGVWIVILIIATVYFSLYGNLLERIHRLESAMLANRRRTMWAIIISFVIVTVLVATAALEQFPNSADEYVYLFQAQQLSEGNLWSDVHPVPDFFEFHHLAQKDGKWVGRFPPGWPVLLSLAYVINIPPFLINTLIGWIAAVVLFRLVRRIYDERIALWSTIAMVFSSYFIFNAATYFSHMASLLEGLLFVYLAYRYLQNEKIIYAFAAGIFLGMLVMTRQLTAVIFLLPFVVYYFYKLKLRALGPLALMAVGALPFVAFFLWYNYKITGDPLVPVTMWTNADEALGFVKGHTPVKGAKFTFKRLAMFFYWASPSLLLLYFFYLVLRAKEFKKILLHPEDYIFLLLIVGYFFYYHSGGNQYGPRFYLEGFPFLVIFVVAKTLRTNHHWFKVFLFAGIIFNVVRIPFIAYREHRIIEERKDIYAQVERKNITNAVVFISSQTGVMRPMPVEDLNRNNHYYRNDVIYARDLGKENVRLMDHYRGSKDFYLYRRKPDVVEGELVKISDEAAN